MSRVLTACIIWLLAQGTVQAQIQFEDVTSTAGYFHTGESWGASWGDFNGDGWSDLFVSNHRDRPSIYRNNGDGTFTNVTLTADGSRSWLNLPLADTHGGTWVDFDADGDQDLMIATGTQIPPQLFVNQGGIFTDQTTAFGIPDDGGGRMSASFDYDNDARMDLVLMNSGSSKILRQKSDGTFVKTNSEIGFDCNGFRANYAQMIDVNNDIQAGGALEFFCMRDGTSPAKVYDTSNIPFIDITSTVPTAANVVDSVSADFDGNLLPDIFMVRGALRPSQALEVSPQKIESFISVGGNATEKQLVFQSSGVLSVNLHTLDYGTFKIFIGVNGVHPADINFTLDPADPNTWGIKPHEPGTEGGLYIGYDTTLGEWRFQLASGGNSVVTYFEIDSSQPISGLTLEGLVAGDSPIQPRLFLNNAGVLENRTALSGVNKQMSCVHAAAGDFDNDMDVDLYLVCRGGVENIENRLFENQGDGTFVERANAGGALGAVGVGLQSGAGTGETAAVSDYNQDGFLDLLVLNGLNLQPIHVGGPDQLFKNSGNSNHWIQLDLVGTASNIEAVGAKVHASAGGVTQLREQNGAYHRWTQDDQRIHFGLGTNTSVDLTVYWPDGQIDTFTNVASDQIYRVTQDPQGGSNGTIEANLFSAAGSFPEPKPGDECGMPAHDADLDRVIVIWKDCTNGMWHIQAMSGGSPVNITYSGSVRSDLAFTNVVSDQLEESDTLDFTTDPKVINFTLKMKGGGVDGFSFNFPTGSKVCFDPVMVPDGAQVLIGAKHLPVLHMSMDLETLGSCVSDSTPANIAYMLLLLLLDE